MSEEENGEEGGLTLSSVSLCLCLCLCCLLYSWI